jgi:hypothetical protein
MTTFKPFEHYCHCGKWGSFGYGVRLLKGQPGTWYCFEHRLQPEPRVVECNPLAIMRDQEKAPMRIPTIYTRKCEICGDDLDSRAMGVFQWTAGWVMQREGGGGHGISLPERADRWAHGYCIDKKARGLLGQKSLDL